jgi:hypothetical protein
MIDLLVSYVDLEGKGEGECSCCLHAYGVDRAWMIHVIELSTLGLNRGCLW